MSLKLFENILYSSLLSFLNKSSKGFLFVFVFVLVFSLIISLLSFLLSSFWKIISNGLLLFALVIFLLFFLLSFLSFTSFKKQFPSF